MEFLFDTADIEAIEKYGACFPITGVTSNPSILKAEGKIDFFAHMRKIRKVIGMEKSLHVQVVAEDRAGIVGEAHAILKQIDDRVYIKIPVTEEGLAAMRVLKSEGAGVTATAVYSRLQGFLAIASGADFIAPYFNRMENLDTDAAGTITAFRRMIDESGARTKILAASFKNIAQVNAAFLAGAHTATVQPALLHEGMGMAAVRKALDDFHADWVKTQGEVSIMDLC